MVAFKITFLLRFNPNIEPMMTRKKGSKTEKKRRETIDNNNEIIKEQLEDHALRTGDFLCFVKVEYELIPKKFKYSIEVTCWKNIAKISTTDAQRYYKTKTSNGKIWVAFTIHHFTNKLSEDEIISLRGHDIHFNINALNKDITDKGAPLYCLKSNAKSNTFVEYFEVDPNELKTLPTKDEAEFYQIAAKALELDNITSWLKFIGKTHIYKVYETISLSAKDNKHLPALEDSTIQSKPLPQKLKSKNKAKKEIVKETTPRFIVPGEAFFTNPRLAIYKLNEPSALITAGQIFLTVQNLMTRVQKTSLNPFVIKTRYLSNLPTDLLKENGFKQIFISYEIPGIGQCDTQPKPIQDTIDFEDRHVYFLNPNAKLTYLEFIRSHLVRAEIKGVKNEEKSAIKPALFGTLEEDINFSKRLEPREADKILREKMSRPHTQVLAIANYDIHLLLRHVWTVREEAPCHHPDHFLCRNNNDHSKKSSKDIAGDVVASDKCTSPLLEGILTLAGTTLDMEFYFLSPQMATRILQSAQISYKRFFLTCYDIYFAKRLLGSILSHNEMQLGMDAIMADKEIAKDSKEVPNYKKSDIAKRISCTKNAPPDDEETIITGFMIDNGYEAHIFVEGISYGFILQVWNQLHKLSPNVADIFINSARDFQTRLYDDFVDIGVYLITLKKPMEEILREHEVYLQGTMPKPCFTALQKLNILLQTPTLEKMIQLNLFPTSKELISFNMEFGVPLTFSLEE